jgi:hypothetical protein
MVITICFVMMQVQNLGGMHSPTTSLDVTTVLDCAHLPLERSPMSEFDFSLCTTSSKQFPDIVLERDLMVVRKVSNVLPKPRRFWW